MPTIIVRDMQFNSHVHINYTFKLVYVSQLKS